MILFYHLIEKRGEIGAGWTFEITEFFQCNRGARVATNVDGFRGMFRVHRLIIDEQRWRKLYSQGIAAGMIGIDSFFGFFTVHVLSELIKIEPERSGIGFEQLARIRSVTPERLFSIQHVVHLPETAL